MDRPVRVRIAKCFMLLAAVAVLSGCSDKAAPPEADATWHPFAESATSEATDRERYARYAPPRLLDTPDRVDRMPRVVPVALEFDAPPLPSKPDSVLETPARPHDDRLHVDPLPDERDATGTIPGEPFSGTASHESDSPESASHESYADGPIRLAPLPPMYRADNREPRMPVVSEEPFPVERPERPERPERLPPVDRHSRWTLQEPIAVESPLIPQSPALSTASEGHRTHWAPPDNTFDDRPEFDDLPEFDVPIVPPASEAIIEVPVANAAPSSVPAVEEPVFEDVVTEPLIVAGPIPEEPLPEEALPADALSAEALPEERALSESEPLPDRLQSSPPPRRSSPPRVSLPPRVSAAVRDRALRVTRHGFILAERGALYSARVEFIQALRLIAQAVDAREGTQRRSQSLSAGLRALKEAGDFVPVGSHLEADLDVRGFVQSHRTPVLKDVDEDALLTPLHAIQRYYSYAQEQLAIAGGGQPAASVALYGMGKVQMALGGGAEGRALDGPKAMALHQAALLVDGSNYRAANELGVLLARYGQLEEAKQVLLHGLAVAGLPETWRNLATVHARLGEAGLAHRARYEGQLAARSQRAGSPTVHEVGQDTNMVRWVDPKTFAQGAAPNRSIRPVHPSEGLPPQEKPLPQEKNTGGVARWTGWFWPMR